LVLAASSISTRFFQVRSSEAMASLLVSSTSRVAVMSQFQRSVIWNFRWWFIVSLKAISPSREVMTALQGIATDSLVHSSSRAREHSKPAGETFT